MNFRHVEPLPASGCSRAERLRHAQFAAEVHVALTRQYELRGMLHRCVVSMNEHLGVSLAQVWLVGASGDALELQASAGLFTSLSSPRSRLPLPGGRAFGLVACACRTVVNGVLGRDLWLGETAPSSYDTVAALGGFPLGYPLSVDTEFLGVLVAFTPRPLPVFTFKTLGLVAGALAFGIACERMSSEPDRREVRTRCSRSLEALAQFAGSLANGAAGPSTALCGSQSN